MTDVQSRRIEAALQAAIEPDGNTQDALRITQPGEQPLLAEASLQRAGQLAIECWRNGLPLNPAVAQTLQLYLDVNQAMGKQVIDDFLY